MGVIFYFDFGRTIANFTLKICYNLVHFRNLYKGVTLKLDILPTKQSMNLTTLGKNACKIANMRYAYPAVIQVKISKLAA